MFLNKKAFSYIELLFGMVIVVIIFSASIPFITRKADSQPALPGNYICFSAYDNDTSSFRLYQTMRRGNANYSELEDVTENGCVFYKQKNIRTYNVTLIGGGGASNRATETSVALGQAGKRISIPETTLAGVWDENNRLNIRMCKNNGLKNIVMPYEKEFDHCVGVGGVAHRNANLGSTSQNEEVYTNLLGVYHDVLYEARTNVDTVTYVGLGNGFLDVDDVDVLGSLTNSPEQTEIINGINSYLSLDEAARSVSDKEELLDVVRILRTRLANRSYDAPPVNQGGMGGYSRFVLYDTNPFDCTDGFGNCIADGGLGGGYTDNDSVVTPDVSQGAETNTMLENIRTAITAGTANDAVLMEYLGHAGPQCGIREEVLPAGEEVVVEDVEVVIPGEWVTVRDSTATEAQCRQYWARYNSFKNRGSGLFGARYRRRANDALNSYNNACCSCTKQVQLEDQVVIEQRERVVEIPGEVIRVLSDTPVANGGAIVIGW